MFFFFFFFNDTATTEIYTLSLHDALPISLTPGPRSSAPLEIVPCRSSCGRTLRRPAPMEESHSSSVRRSRSEEHTSELQSPCNLVCRLLLEKKKQKVTD